MACSWIKKLKHALWLIPSILILFLAIHFTFYVITNNFHTVLPGKLYRSAQLEPNEFVAVVNKYHIHTVINLRGIHPESTWYRGELRVSEVSHLQHYNVTLPAHDLPIFIELKRLVTLMEKSPKPILVHCRQGADRTGLASAIGLILSGERSKNSIIKQMTWRYNVFSPQTVGYQVMTNYFVWLKENNFTCGKQSFLRWIDSKPTLKHYSGVFWGVFA